MLWYHRSLFSAIRYTALLRGGGGVLRCCLDGGARLKPPNPYPSLRVILAERVPIIRDFS